MPRFGLNADMRTLERLSFALAIFLVYFVTIAKAPDLSQKMKVFVAVH